MGSHALNNYIVVDSADRDNASITNASDYSYTLPSSIRNAATIELLSFQMIRSDTVINDGNATFGVTINGFTSNVSMVAQEVTTGSNLAIVLQTALAPMSASFTVAFTDLTDSLTISHPTYSFSLNLLSCSTARILGLYGNGVRGIGTISSSLVGGKNVIVSTRAVDVNAEPYILMHINDYQRNIGASSIIQQSFMLIPLEEETWRSRFSICNDEKDHKGTYYLAGHQHRIDKLRIRFYRPDGSFYNFRGQDHQMTFRVVKSDCKGLHDLVYKMFLTVFASFFEKAIC